MASRPSDWTFARPLAVPGGGTRATATTGPPVATLRFALPHAASGSVVVVNLDGLVVRTLLAPTLPAGELHAEWDGRDELGDRAPRGLYCMRLEVEGRLLTSRRVEIH